MKVRDIMARPVVVVREETRLDEIAKIMLERRIGGLPVVDAYDKLIGIVTESDFSAKERAIPFPLVRAPQLLDVWLEPGGAEKIYAAARSLTARDIMRAPVVTVAQDDSLELVLRAMLRHDIDRIPVVQDGVPIGIVARRDLLLLMLEHPPVREIPTSNRRSRKRV